MDIDLACYDFTMKIISEIQESGLPSSVVSLILKDILKEVDFTKNQIVNEALKTREKENNDSNKKGEQK